jgi:hypothetical protein
VFERVVTSNLNQEFMSFTRQLDIELLRPLVSNLKGLLNIHQEVCTKAQNSAQGFFDTKDKSLSPTQQYYMTPRTALFTPRFGPQHESTQICSLYSSHLPEYTIETAETIQSICRQDSLTNIPVDIYLNASTNDLHYKSNDLIVPETLFSNFFIYNDNKSPYVRSELSKMAQYLFEGSIYLNHCSTNSPALTFLAPGSQSTKLVKIVCEVDHNIQKSPDDLASHFVYQWVSQSCQRDHPVISQHVEHAITEVNNILNYQIDPRKLLTYAQYFPQLVSQPSALTSSNHMSVNILSSPSSFLQSAETSVKQKRSAYNYTDVIQVPEHNNLTEISAEDFFKALNISSKELKH